MMKPNWCDKCGGITEYSICQKCLEETEIRKQVAEEIRKIDIGGFLGTMRVTFPGFNGPGSSGGCTHADCESFRMIWKHFKELLADAIERSK